MKRQFAILPAVVAGLLWAASPARASVSLNLDIENIHGLDTLTLAPAGSTAVLLVSTIDGDFGDLTLAGSAFTVEADDRVLGMFSITPEGILQNAVGFSFADGITQNDPLLLVWYPNLTYSAGLTGPGQGQLFGDYRSDIATLASDLAWFVPADGSTLNLSAFTESAGGDVLDSLLVASQFTVVPEPSTYLLVGLGLISMRMLVRRRHA